MKYILINNDNVELLQKFISLINSKNFRYYENRDISIIKNHIITVIITNDNEDIIGYGHLDYEVFIWLGIYVCEEFRNLGYGKKIIEFLINYAKEKKIDKIYLTVDKINNIAINMYKKYGFIIENQNHSVNIFKMIKNIN